MTRPTTRPTIRPINPATLAAPLARYSHAVAFPAAAEVLMTSGQLALPPDGPVPDDPAAQCELIFTALDAILRAAGFEWSGVVKFTAFVTDRASFPLVGAARARWCPGVAFASTLVIVSGFTRPELQVEVELTAIRT